MSTSPMTKPRIRMPAGRSVIGHNGGPPMVPSASIGPSGAPSGGRTNNEAAGLEAGRYSRRLSTFLPARQNINTLIANSGGTITARSRFLARNNGYASIATEEFASAMVGYGIMPNWQIDDTELSKKTTQLWKQWVTEADSEGLTDFYGMQKRAARELFLAGEVFFRERPRYISDGLSVPLQYQMLPSEMLDPAYNVDLGNGNSIRQGIEFNRIGRRVGYHFWRVHPEDTTGPTMGRGERTFVPAKEVIHVLDPVEAGQIRGLSKLSPVIVKMWTLDQYDDAELEKKKTAALFTGFIQRPDPQGKMLEEADDDDDDDSPVGTITLEPGAMHVLDVGEEVTFSEPTESGNSYEPFQYRTILQICSGTGIPYFTMSGDLVKANYSSARVGLINFRRRIEALQYSVFVQLLCRPVWRSWLEQAMLAGALDIPDYKTNQWTYLNVEWITPAWEWVDPKNDIEAETASINAGLKSRSAAIKERGMNPEEVDEEIARDQAREKKLGIKIGAAKASPAPSAGKPVGDPSIEPDDEEDNPEGDKE